MIAAITTWTSDCNAPTPRPWNARAAISWPTFWDSPANSEPSTKMAMPICSSSFLLNRSASLPQIGVLAVIASSVAVTTQVYWVCEPLSEPMMRGRAMDTTVELIIATNRTSSSPLNDSSTCRRPITSGVSKSGSFPSTRLFPRDAQRRRAGERFPLSKLSQSEISHIE